MPHKKSFMVTAYYPPQTENREENNIYRLGYWSAQNTTIRFESFATGQFPLTRIVSSRWPRFHRGGQKLHTNRLWRLCRAYLKKAEQMTGSIIGPAEKKKRKVIFFLPARLLVRPWPDQPDRLLRPCIPVINDRYLCVLELI